MIRGTPLAVVGRAAELGPRASCYARNADGLGPCRLPTFRGPAHRLPSLHDTATVRISAIKAQHQAHVHTLYGTHGGWGLLCMPAIVVCLLRSAALVCDRAHIQGAVLHLIAMPHGAAEQLDITGHRHQQCAMVAVWQARVCWIHAIPTSMFGTSRCFASSRATDTWVRRWADESRGYGGRRVWLPSSRGSDLTGESVAVGSLDAGCTPRLEGTSEVLHGGGGMALRARRCTAGSGGTGGGGAGDGAGG